MAPSWRLEPFANSFLEDRVVLIQLDCCLTLTNFRNLRTLRDLPLTLRWPADRDISIHLPRWNVRNNYRRHLLGYIHQPESFEYTFAAALGRTRSTVEAEDFNYDSGPASAVMIASESRIATVVVRNYQRLWDESVTSAPDFTGGGQGCISLNPDIQNKYRGVTYMAISMEWAHSEGPADRGIWR